MAARDTVDLILASTSRYRAALLRRIAPTFRQIAPEIDETRHHGEAPAALARRLARAKALATAKCHPETLVIGSDQVAALADEVLGKPGNVAQARSQLAACSGREVIFHTAVSIADARNGLRCHEGIDVTRVVFRPLDAIAIARYVERDRPLDCAGSFKAEALGIALFERIESDDPTGLIGLPLILTCQLLRKTGIDVL